MNICVRKAKGTATDGGFDDVCYIFFESGFFERPILILRETDLKGALKEVGLKVMSV